jgi:hypothetical protein
MLRPPTDLDAAFRHLAAKYAVEVPAHRVLDESAGTPPDAGESLVPGWSLLGRAEAKHFIPLLPWRSERRFVELKRLVDGGTVAPVVMCRFSCFTTGDPMGLKAILYRELDLVEWLTGSPIVAVCASMAAGRSANVLVRVQSGLACSVEAGATLPPAAQPPVVDRHELIAQRGVASDHVVDTQLPQSSIYTFTGKGMDRYTDTDAELFGLDSDRAALVRAAYGFAAQPDRVDALRRQHRRLAQLIELSCESDRTRQRMTVQGGDA